MLIKYSPSKNIFYPEFILTEFPDIVPQDAVELPTDIHKQFYNVNPPKGMIRAAGKDGMPTWVPMPVSEEPAEVKKARILSETAAKISTLADVAEFGDASVGEELTRLRKYRAAVYLYDTKSGKDWPTY